MQYAVTAMSLWSVKYATSIYSPLDVMTCHVPVKSRSYIHEGYTACDTFFSSEGGAGAGAGACGFPDGAYLLLLRRCGP